MDRASPSLADQKVKYFYWPAGRLVPKASPSAQINRLSESMDRSKPAPVPLSGSLRRCARNPHSRCGWALAVRLHVASAYFSWMQLALCCYAELLRVTDPVVLGAIHSCAYLVGAYVTQAARQLSRGLAWGRC